MIVAKFRCSSLEVISEGKRLDGTPRFAENVRLVPLYDEVNKTWSEFAPNGDVKLSITSPAAQGKFVPGEIYYAEFKPEIAR